MKPLTISLQIFETIFPFSFSVSRSGNFQSFGPSLQKLIPSLTLSENFEEIFQFRRPHLNDFEAHWKDLLGEMIVLTEKSGKFELMGQILYLKEQDRLLFVVSLLVQDPKKLDDLHLTFDDFAIQDQVFDFMMLIQSQRRTMEDMEAMNRRLNEANSIATKASLLKSQFLANMSHELRTPMNGVLGMASVLLETPLDSDQKDYVETIVTSGEGMLTLVNDILDLSKIEAGHIELEEEEYSLSSLIESAMEGFKVQARKKNLHLSFETDNHIPSRMIFDPNRLKQVLINLIGNAVKFTHEGSVRIKAECLFLRATNIGIRVSVVDTGIGMNEETLKAIFSPFVQGDSSMNKTYGGTGLGLSICKRIVEAMGGKAGVKSKMGVGSNFYFEIQLEVPHPAESQVG